MHVAVILRTFRRPKHLELSQAPSITAVVNERGNGGDGRNGRDGGSKYSVTLSCSSAALWVWIELTESDLRSNDNFVHLRPGSDVTLTVTPGDALTLREFREQLIVRSLVDLSLR